MTGRLVDVFNGDADGICALRQLRLAEPAEARLVTGLKHDIRLLARVEAGAGDTVTVLDISLERNRADLERLLARGARVRWFDHHRTGDVPAHPRLEAVLDPTGEACTSELVDRRLGGRFRAWAVAGAFGDNLPGAALRLAAALPERDAERLQVLRTLGEALNYNAYGATMADVMLPPDDLYRIASAYADPFELAEGEFVVERLHQQRLADLANARAQTAIFRRPEAQAYVLPDAAWSRRVIGSFANGLALAEPHRAHAVLAPLDAGAFAVSVRTPPRAVPDAAQFCAGFATGGGRPRAAGIERLERATLGRFIGLFERAWLQGVPA